MYICHNNTIYGTTYKKLPNTKGKILVADMSSDILSQPVNVSDYGLIYFGVQKNVGPAGVVIVIIREDLIRDDVPTYCPTMLKYKTQADNDSLYNTPPCYGIYICGLVFKWVKEMGGLSAMKIHNEKKAAILYDFLDSSKIFGLGITAAVSGIIGAKILFVITEIPTIIQDPRAFFKTLTSEGFVVYGGIIFGILCCMFYCRRNKMDFIRYFDLTMPSVALAQGFGRLGCFLAGCCYGRATDA